MVVELSNHYLSSGEMLTMLRQKNSGSGLQVLVPGTRFCLPREFTGASKQVSGRYLKGQGA